MVGKIGELSKDRCDCLANDKVIVFFAVSNYRPFLKCASERL